jgi:hypothetical protein
MRRSVRLAPIRLGHWEQAGARGVEMLTLNHDPDTGARTALIRSAPRDGIEDKSHYHHCEEEFLCLAGRFSFDGQHWMRPLSYACYPSHVVHGTRVSVPGGYLLYLRTSGSTQAYVAAQEAECATADPIIQYVREPAATTGFRRRVLRTQPEMDAAVTLWGFADDARDIFQHFPAATPLEVLVFRPGSEALDGEDSLALAYGHFGPGDVRPCFDADGSSVALVHSGRWA